MAYSLERHGLYRAVGILKGNYRPSAEILHHGIVETDRGIFPARLQPNTVRQFHEYGLSADDPVLMEVIPRNAGPRYPNFTLVVKRFLLEPPPWLPDDTDDRFAIVQGRVFHARGQWIGVEIRRNHRRRPLRKETRAPRAFNVFVWLPDHTVRRNEFWSFACEIGRGTLKVRQARKLMRYSR